eukprot:scaffold206909_cov27-Tisochrysis_lutea.AAC.3
MSEPIAPRALVHGAVLEDLPALAVFEPRAPASYVGGALAHEERALAVALPVGHLACVDLALWKKRNTITGARGCLSVKRGLAVFVVRLGPFANIAACRDDAAHRVRVLGVGWWLLALSIVRTKELLDCLRLPSLDISHVGRLGFWILISRLGMKCRLNLLPARQLHLFYAPGLLLCEKRCGDGFDWTREARLECVG